MLGGEGGATEAYSEYAAAVGGEAAGRADASEARRSPRLSQRRRWVVFIGLSEVEGEAGVQAVRPEVRPLELEGRPGGPDERRRIVQADGLTLRRVDDPIDLVARAHDVAGVEEAVPQDDRGPVRQPEPDVDAGLGNDRDDVARVRPDVRG